MNRQNSIRTFNDFIYVLVPSTYIEFREFDKLHLSMYLSIKWNEMK